MMLNSKWKLLSPFRMGILLVAFCIVSPRFGYAQDFDAIERKLEESIRAGDLSSQDAAIMLNALKRSRKSARGHDRNLKAKKDRYQALAREIEAAVKSGRLSEEAARKKLIALRKETAGDTSHKNNDADGKKAVDGDKGQNRDLEAKKNRYQAYAGEIEAAVKSGDLSRQEADRKLIEVRARLFRNGGRKPAARKDPHGISVEDYQRGETQIQELVKQGKVSREDAQKRLAEMRRLVVRGTDTKAAGDGDKRQEQELEAKKRRYEAYAGKIEAAVKSGDLSRQEADRKLIEVRARLFRNGGRKPAAGKDPRVTGIKGVKPGRGDTRDH